MGTSHAKCRPQHGLDGIFAPADFTEPLIREAIKKLKYKNVQELGQALGRFLAESLSRHFAGFLRGDVLIVPVPLYITKEKRRGYNQSKLLAQALVECLNLPLAECLTRKIDTISQTKLDKKRRIENVRNAFALAGDWPVAGKFVFLVDDVTTTGATLRECAKVLKRHGASTVWGLAIAQE